MICYFIVHTTSAAKLIDYMSKMIQDIAIKNYLLKCILYLSEPFMLPYFFYGRSFHRVYKFKFYIHQRQMIMAFNCQMFPNTVILVGVNK